MANAVNGIISATPGTLTTINKGTLAPINNDKFHFTCLWDMWSIYKSSILINLQSFGFAFAEKNGIFQNLNTYCETIKVFCH